MRYYIIAGEASGDMHAANMMKQLKQLDKDAYFRVWGGDRMSEEAQELAKHIRETSFMGVFAVVSHLSTIKANFKFCEEDILSYKPDVLILIDNSGFNLRIAKFVRGTSLKTKIFYYILPQAWAWKKKRVHTIQDWTDKRFSILPFERAFYQSYGYDVEYVGHPILDSIAKEKEFLVSKDQFYKEFNLKDKPIIALLPGSRKREIKTKLPVMLTAVKHFSDYQFVIAGSSTIDSALYQQFNSLNLPIIFNRTYDVLNNAKAAIVTSGTATLETALFRVPQVVCYKPGWATFHLMRFISTLKYICMVNLILDRKVVEELIESRLNEKHIVAEVKKLLSPVYRDTMLSSYNELEDKLGGVGASERVAKLMYEAIQN